MHFLLHSPVLALLVRYISASTGLDIVESRFGLSFGPITIIASRFNSSNTIELTKFAASSEYRAFYGEAVRRFNVSKTDVDDTSARSIFEESIKPITEALTKRLGEAPEYSALYAPSVFDYTTRLAASEVVFQDVEYINTYTRTSPVRAACWPYHFLDGKNLGREPHECNDDGPENFIIFLEYEEEYMYAWLKLVEYELGVYQGMYSKICKGCGEKHREIMGEQAYQQQVKSFVHEFIEMSVPQQQREDIRAIIIAGDATPAAITELGNIALDAVGTSVVKLMTQIDPSEVIAYGAAAWARMMQQHPELFVSTDCQLIPSDEEYAAMLEKLRLAELAELASFNELVHLNGIARLSELHVSRSGGDRAWQQGPEFCVRQGHSPWSLAHVPWSLFMCYIGYNVEALHGQMLDKFESRSSRIRSAPGKHA